MCFICVENLQNKKELVPLDNVVGIHTVQFFVDDRTVDGVKIRLKVGGYVYARESFKAICTKIEATGARVSF